MQRVRRPCGGRGVRLARRVLLALVALAAVAGTTWLVARDADRSLRADLLQQARLVAGMIHLEHVAELSGTQMDLAAPNYESLKQSLVRARAAHPRCRFLYLMGRRSDGRIFFYADSELAGTPDYSPPGQIYEDASPLFLKAFATGTEGTEGPARDAWGTWVSAFVPMPVAAGDSPIVLGMDITAGHWMWAVVARAALPAGTSAAAVVLGLLVARLARANREVRRREAQLRESFQTSADLVRAIPSGLYLYQYAPPDRFALIGGNPEAERLTGLHAEDWIGRDLEDVWPGSHAAGITATYVNVMRTGKAFAAEDLAHTDGRVGGNFRVSAFPLPGERLAVAFEDVTDRAKAQERVRELLDESTEARAALLSILEDEKRVEESLRRSEERFALAFRTSPYALTITRARDGQFLEVNDAFSSVSGYTREEASANSSIGLGIWVNEEDRRAVVAALQRGEAVVGREFLFRHKNGQTITGLFSAQIMMLNDEPCVLSSINDITERKQAEAERQKLQAQLAQSQRMEFVGRLAGGIAHDFNNLLMGIMNYVELCRDRVGLDQAVRGWLDEIASDARRSADLTRQLLAFARRQTIAPSLLDLNTAVPAMLRMLRRLLGEDIELIWLPGPGPMLVTMDPSQLDQILVNLAVNARDAITGAGRLVLETKSVVLRQGAAPPDVPPGDYVQLAVSDNGCGMSPETLEHAFEPFFTTKANGEGTGLGLATVYGIVQQNGGFIEAVSERDEGTTFRIHLPRGQGTTHKATRIAEATTRLDGREVILVAEDEKSVRITLEQFLKDLGYVVLAAAAPEEALDLASKREGMIDLLITDVVMPGMSGRALAARLAERRPRLRCLFMSGYTADVIAHHGVLDAGTDFLAKPFTRDELARKVREILDR